MNKMAKNGSPARLWLRALEAVSKVEQDRSLTFGAVLNDLADLHGDRIALLDERAALSFRDLAVCANCYASWVQRKEFRPGTVIALFMMNCAEYAGIWAGLSQAGCTVALINTNLSGAALVHAISVADCAAVIVDSALYGIFAEIAEEVEGIPHWVYGMSEDCVAPRLDLEILAFDGERNPVDLSEEDIISNPALLIYTSGTTGFPKAVKVSHARVLQWSYWFAGLMETGTEDRLYNCLPMYHSTGGVCAIGALLVRGGSVVLRRRFSGRRFWRDIVETESTIFQYIGELCRYLLKVPPNELETQHRLRLCCGNGLREDVWKEFEQRFHIPRILEFYAATEGSVSLYNCDGKPGAIGRVPGFLAHRFPLTLVQYDPGTDDYVRGDDGYCMPCNVDEVGEALGRLDPDNAAMGRRFEGYINKALSEKKLARNVFRNGDLWYRTGDLMRKDRDGFYYFIDRLGDAFRWKGENVSASEVASVIAGCHGVVDAVVFGVQVPGNEGQAGMACIVADEGFEIETLWAHVHGRLPAYACPVFLRLCDVIDRTGTFKLNAARLKADGYRNVPLHGLWFDDRRARAYIPATCELQEMLTEGMIDL